MSSADTAQLLNIGVLVFSYSLAFVAYKNRKNKRFRSIIDQPPWRIMAVLLIIIGTITSVIGIVAYQSHKIPSGYKYSVGTVTEIKQVPYTTYSSGVCSNGSCMSPRTEYRKVGTISFRVESKVYNFEENVKDAHYLPGQNVKVAYNPNNPTVDPRNTSNHSDDAVGQVALVVGVVTSISGATILHIGRHR